MKKTLLALVLLALVAGPAAAHHTIHVQAFGLPYSYYGQTTILSLVPPTLALPAPAPVVQLAQPYQAPVPVAAPAPVAVQAPAAVAVQLAAPPPVYATYGGGYLLRSVDLHTAYLGTPVFVTPPVRFDLHRSFRRGK